MEILKAKGWCIFEILSFPLQSILTEVLTDVPLIQQAKQTF